MAQATIGTSVATSTASFAPALTQIERQASGFSPRFERSGRNGLLLLNVLPQYFNRGTAA